MTEIEKQWPDLTLPADEAKLLRQAYEAATVILEYGSGGSTVLGAQLSGKLIMSVESSRTWALELQHKIDAGNFASPVIVHHVDIGPTGDWGRAVDETSWRKFHRYPTAIWSEPFFRHPDLILIDGRFRPACFVNACLRIRRPVTVLFDDYADREAYYVVERLFKPVNIVGRMAEFKLEPREWPYEIHDLFMSLCTEATFSKDEHFPYKRVQSE